VIRLKKKPFLLFFISLFLLSISQFFGIVSGDLGPGDLAPEFTVTDIYGNNFSLSDFRGKVLFIEFFTTWCSICKDEIPDLKTIRNNFTEQELAMISLSFDDNNTQLIDYKNTYGIYWPVAYCSWTHVYNAYEVPGVPTMFVISPEGEIVYKHSGNFDPNEIIQKITEQLNADPVEPIPEPSDPEPTDPEPSDPEPDTEPPLLSVLSPENQTYSMKLCTVGNCTASVPLTFTVNEPTAWIGYNVDNQPMETTSGNTTIINLLDGEHSLVVYATDSSGNNASSNTIHFTIDTTPPLIIEISQALLKNKVTSEDEIVINVTVVDTLSEVEQVALNYTNGDLPWVVVNMNNVEGNIWNIGLPFSLDWNNLTYTLTLEDTVGNVRTTEQFCFEIEPEPTEPEPTEPEPTEPEPTEPEPTDPTPAEPEPTEPTAEETEILTPTPTTSEPTTEVAIVVAVAIFIIIISFMALRRRK
jgi:peroxiredoxin/cell division septation protein DedD